MRRSKQMFSDDIDDFIQANKPEFYEISNTEADQLIQSSVPTKLDLAAAMQLVKIFPPTCKGENKRKCRIINSSGALLILYCNICRSISKSYILTGPADLLSELTYGHGMSAS